MIVHTLKLYSIRTKKQFLRVLVVSNKKIWVVFTIRYFICQFWIKGVDSQVGLALVRAMLYVARPATCKLGNIPDSNLYRDVEQYPGATGIPGFLVLQLGSPIYFANGSYIKERLVIHQKYCNMYFDSGKKKTLFANAIL